MVNKNQLLKIANEDFVCLGEIDDKVILRGLGTVHNSILIASDKLNDPIQLKMADIDRKDSVKVERCYRNYTGFICYVKDIVIDYASGGAYVWYQELYGNNEDRLVEIEEFNKEVRLENRSNLALQKHAFEEFEGIQLYTEVIEKYKEEVQS